MIDICTLVMMTVMKTQNAICQTMGRKRCASHFIKLPAHLLLLFTNANVPTEPLTIFLR
jgi:hypothetical protein